MAEQRLFFTNNEPRRRSDAFEKMVELVLVGCIDLQFVPKCGTGGTRASAADVKTGDDEVLFKADFEDGVLGQWRPRASEKLDIVTQVGLYDSTRSLRTSSRTETFHGPLVEVLDHVQKGSTVHISFWAMYDEGPDSQVLNGALEKEYNKDASSLEYATFASATLNKGQWKKVEADVVIPEENSGITGFRMYVETPWKTSAEVTPADDFILRG